MFNIVLSLVDLMLPFRQNHLVLGLEIRRNTVDLLVRLSKSAKITTTDENVRG